MNPATTVSCTGHRPEKIKNGCAEESTAVTEIKEKLRDAILEEIEAGCTCFLTGMAMGADLWAAEIVLELKKDYPQLELVAVVPFAGQANAFPPRWKARYDAVLSKSSDVRILSPHYYKSCYHVRNRWLLEHSEHLIAVFNGSRGGTMQTLNDALLKGHDVKIIHC